MTSANANKTHRGRFVKNVSLCLFLALLISFVFFPLSGLLGRSTESVKGSEWISNVGTLSFSDNVCRYVDNESAKTYTYLERYGTVTLYADSGELETSFTRFGDKKLITSDGRTIYTLKEGTSNEQKQ